MECQHLVTFWGVAPAAAATGYNPCPGSRPLANHVPRGCTNPFPTLTLIKHNAVYKKINVLLHTNHVF